MKTSAEFVRNCPLFLLFLAQWSSVKEPEEEYIVSNKLTTSLNHHHSHCH